MLAVLLAVLLAVTPVSPTRHLVRDMRVVRGDMVATSQVLNRIASTRVGVFNHDGLGDVCPLMVGGHRVSLCGEIKGWVTRATLDAAVDWVVPAWMASPTHHRILRDPLWRWVGVAVRRVGAYVWLVAIFAR